MLDQFSLLLVLIINNKVAQLSQHGCLVSLLGQILVTIFFMYYVNCLVNFSLKTGYRYKIYYYCNYCYLQQNFLVLIRVLNLQTYMACFFKMACTF